MTDKNLPPHDSDAEQAVLGAILKDPEAMAAVLEVFSDDTNFYTPAHQTIFRACLDLYAKSQPCDITTVATVLQRNGQLEKVGGRAYLVELTDSIVSSSHVTSHAGIVLDEGVARRLISISGEIQRSAYAHDVPVEDLLDSAEQAIFQISNDQVRQGFVATSSLIPGSIRQIEAIQGGGTWADSVPTGFDSLDDITQGLHKGNFIIVAGRPSMGKTGLAMNMVENVTNTTQEKRAVAVFSIEMSKEELTLRLLCGRAKVSQTKLRRGKLTDAEFTDIAKAGQHFERTEIFIDDSATLTPLQLRSKARRLKSRCPHLSLVVVDYIQLMNGAGRSENRQQELTVISRSLKALAKELELPVIACSQLSRAVELRGGDRRPQLSDLRESGAIEQDADQVLFVFRPEYYLTEDERRDPKNFDKVGVAEIIVAKHRNGPTGTARLTFLKDFARFENSERFRQLDQPAKSDQQVFI